MNLKESVRQWVLRELPYDPADANLIAYLNGLDAHGLLVVYHNWMSRLIKPQPRQVRKSKAFLQNPLVVERTNEFAQIIDDVEKGWDLRKYLSRGIKTAVTVPGKPFGKRRDLDLMLNAQGVHHLHISTEVGADDYVKRGGPLLFAVFKPRTAYLIDVMGHGDWTRDRVVEVLANEWPNESLVHEIKGVIDLASNYTEDERAMLQKNGVNTAVEIDGKVLLPAGAMTAIGTSLAAGREADKVLLQIDIFVETYIKNPRKLRTVFETHGAAFPKGKPQFEFAIQSDGCGVIETVSRTWIPFNSMPLSA